MLADEKDVMLAVRLVVVKVVAMDALLVAM